jgi:hypothetical protein
MKLVYIFFFTSIIFWITPLFKQYKTEYFLYFLIIALADPFTFVFLKLFHIIGNRFIVFFALLLLCSLTTNIKIKKLLLLSTLPVFVIAVSYSLNNQLIMYLGCIIHIIILGKIIMKLLNRFFNSQSLNFFLSLLFLNELVYAFRYLAVILNNESGAMNSFIGAISQIVLAVFFAFVNINTKEFSFARKKE